MRPKAILFDLDNTLVHRQLSIDAYAALFFKYFESCLAPVSIASIAEIIQREDNGGYLPPDSPHGSIREAVAFALLGKLSWKRATTQAEIASHWLEHFPSQTVAMPGASELIQSLISQGLRIGVISNGAQGSREATVATLEFNQHIELLVSSEAAGIRKPDMRIFQHTLSLLGLLPEDCWYIGDHPVNDIKGASDAGMRAVWLSGFHAWPQGQQRPLLTATQLSDVLSLVLDS